MQGRKAEARLPSPLCGVLPGSGAPALAQLLVEMSPVDVRAVAEEQVRVGTRGGEGSNVQALSPAGALPLYLTLRATMLG